MNLEGADGSYSSTTSSNNANARLPRRGRSPAEWLAPSRLVFADEIWKRRYDFGSIRKVLLASEYVSSPLFLSGWT